MNPHTIHPDTGTHIRFLFREHIGVRWTIRKWVDRVRRRIMDKRIVGEVDLYTTEAIPTDSLVSVYDLKSKSKYMFHTNTICRILLSGLTYNTYGIAEPKAPTNPYTNIPWSIGQLISIVGQIIHNLNRHHCSIPYYIYLFRKEMYNLKTFLSVNNAILQTDASVAFFKNAEDPYRNEIYNELVEDLYLDNHDQLTSDWRTARSLIVNRNIVYTLMEKWDILVLSSWIWLNHKIVYMQIEDIDAEFIKLHFETMSWWRAQVLRQMDRAPPSPSLTAHSVTAHSVTATTNPVRVALSSQQIRATPPPSRAATPPMPPTPALRPTPPPATSRHTSPAPGAPANSPSTPPSARISPAPPPRYVLTESALPALHVPRRSIVSTTSATSRSTINTVIPALVAQSTSPSTLLSRLPPLPTIRSQSSRQLMPPAPPPVPQVARTLPPSPLSSPAGSVSSTPVAPSTTLAHGSADTNPIIEDNIYDILDATVAQMRGNIYPSRR